MGLEQILGAPCWYYLPLTEGIADTNTLTAVDEIVDDPFQGYILQAEVLEFLVETGMLDSVRLCRKLSRGQNGGCDAKTFISALRNLVHESGELELGAVIYCLHENRIGPLEGRV